MTPWYAQDKDHSLPPSLPHCYFHHHYHHLLPLLVPPSLFTRRTRWTKPNTTQLACPYPKPQP